MSFTNQTLDFLDTKYVLTASGWTLSFMTAGYIALFIVYFTLYFWVYSDQEPQPRISTKKIRATYNELEEVRANLATSLQILTSFAGAVGYDPTDVDSHLDNLNDIMTYCRAVLPHLKGDQTFYLKAIDNIFLRCCEIQLENTPNQMVEDEVEDDGPASRTRSKTCYSPVNSRS